MNNINDILQPDVALFIDKNYISKERLIKERDEYIKKREETNNSLVFAICTNYIEIYNKILNQE